MDTHSLLFRVLFFSLLVILIDTVLWFRLKHAAQNNAWIRRIRLSIPIITLLFGLSLGLYFWLAGKPGLDPVAYRRVFIFTGLFQIIWLPRLVYVVLDLITLVFLLIWRKTRVALHRNLLYLNLGIGLLMTLACLHAVFIGKHDVRLREIHLNPEGLPVAFQEISLLQISDTHLGSFGDIEKARRGLQRVFETSPDIIVVTGDLINIIAEEAYPYEDVLTSMRAPMGKYAILGNHDIGDYVKGDTIRPPEINRALLREFYRRTGFILLEDSAVVLHKDGDSLLLAGVDNWGLPPFRQEGDLAQALSGRAHMPAILLSHDPTHWDAEVRQHPQVLLTLSGHTHGMQLGFRFPGFQWSPAQYKYPRWVGVYQEGSQYLYVNPGFGFIGMPSRLGIYPELSLITLGGS